MTHFRLKWIGKRWNRKEPQYVSFNEAIKIIADCGYYEAGGHDKMWESMGVTPETYYKSQLWISLEEEEKNFNLYGRKTYNPSCLQKIESRDFNRLKLNDENTCLVSDLKQNIYTDISFKRDELYNLVKMLKGNLLSNKKKSIAKRIFDNIKIKLRHYKINRIQRLNRSRFKEYGRDKR